MPVKKPVEKTAKNVRQDKRLKSVKKHGKNIPKKITLDDLLKSQDEAWKAIRETQKNVGGLNNSLGSIVERLLIPGLPKKFKKFGYNFNRIASYCYADGVYAQIDGMLENGDKRQFMGAMAAFITDKSTKNYALKQGLFVIEPSGEDIKGTRPETEPRVW